MKKKAMISCALILSGFFLAGVIAQGMPALKVSAYLAHRNEKENVVKIGDNTSEIVEEFDPPDAIHPDTPYAKTVLVQNKTDTACYVRVFVEKDRSDLPVTINFDTKYWTGKQADGYYYYRTVLEGNKKTEPLFTTVTTGKTEETFRILVYEETVQAQGYETPEEAFASIRVEQERGK